MTDEDTDEEPEEKHIRFEIPKDEYEELVEFKQRHGLTWEGVMKYGTIRE